MASLKNHFAKRAGAWEVAKPYNDGSGDLYLQGGRWAQPDTILPVSEGVPIVLARIGKGQVLGVARGGVYAVDPPTP